MSYHILGVICQTLTLRHQSHAWHWILGQCQSLIGIHDSMGWLSCNSCMPIFSSFCTLSVAEASTSKLDSIAQCLSGHFSSAPFSYICLLYFGYQLRVRFIHAFLPVRVLFLETRIYIASCSSCGVLYILSILHRTFSYHFLSPCSLTVGRICRATTVATYPVSLRWCCCPVVVQSLGVTQLYSSEDSSMNNWHRSWQKSLFAAPTPTLRWCRHFLP